MSRAGESARASGRRGRGRPARRSRATSPLRTWREDSESRSRSPRRAEEREPSPIAVIGPRSVCVLCGTYLRPDTQPRYIPSEGALLCVCNICALLRDLETLWPLTPPDVDRDRLVELALSEVYLALRDRVDSGLLADTELHSAVRVQSEGSAAGSASSADDSW